MHVLYWLWPCVVGFRVCAWMCRLNFVLFACQFHRCRYEPITSHYPRPPSPPPPHQKAYWGKREHLLPFLEGLGYTCPPLFNPADFVLVR